MEKILRLSYKLDAWMPLYPGSPCTELSMVKSKERGDSCNTSRIVISNHAGTHIDGPAHFETTGKRISDYDLNSLVFENISVADCCKEAGSPIIPEDLEDCLSVNTDLLLIRTGFSKYRGPVAKGCENDVYCSNNPYLHSDTARMLREHRSSIRAIGIDCISISSLANRDMGRSAHEILLSTGKYEKDPILIIEDMFIPEGPPRIDKVIVVPLYCDDIDSAPCTILGFVADD
ncbi:MAG TPA: cyclase family protein [Syntrophorhabdaceae bacterium]|nr:cyclase family protein [Syntrophorhabdaceae bacterium]